MEKRKLGFEWQSGEDDWQKQQAGHPIEAGRQSDAPKAKHGAWRWRFIVVTLLLCLLSAGGWLWRTAQAGLSTIQEELMAAVQREFWEAAQEDLQLPAGVFDEQANTTWQQYFEKEFVQLNANVKMDAPKTVRTLDVQVLDVQEIDKQEVALVQLVTKSNNGGETYRQSRFYRYTVAGWKRSAPLETLWGPPSRLESSYFVFNFRQRDAEAVAKVAPQLDRLYATLTNNFGQPLLSQQGKLVIEVSVGYPPGQARLSHPFRISSPALYLAPSPLTDDQLLVQSIALALLNDRLGQAKILPVWQPMLESLRLWQLWDLKLPLSVWQDESVAWVYGDAVAAKGGRPLVLPEWYRPLCAMHSLWMDSPLRLHIPLLCNKAPRSDWDVVLRYLQMPITQLDQTGVPVVWPEEHPDLQKVMPNLSHPGQAVALATLIAYAVNSYGQDRLPLFMAALGQYDSWETLVPAVFGVSPSEFEDGWKRYLAIQGENRNSHFDVE